MWHQFSQFAKKSFFDEKGNRIAFCVDLLISKKKGKITAFLVREFPLAPLKKVSPDDIVISDEAILLKKRRRLKKFQPLKSCVRFLNLSVQTESGKNLGKIKDVIFEDQGFWVFKLVVEKCFLCLFKFWNSEKIIFRDQIIKITDKAVIIEEELAKNKAEVASPIK